MNTTAKTALAALPIIVPFTWTVAAFSESGGPAVYGRVFSRFAGFQALARRSLPPSQAPVVMNVVSARWSKRTAEKLSTVYQQLGSQMQVLTRETELAPLLSVLGALLMVVGGGLSVLWFNRLG